MGWDLLAAVLGAAGLGLAAWSGVELGWRRGLGLTDEPPDPVLPSLVMRGPFRRVRDPRSSALLLIVAAAAIWWRTPAMWLLAAGLAVLIVALARRDDRQRAARFGEAYARYREVAPLLLPRRR